MFSISINLLDNNNNQITFVETKNEQMNRKLSPSKSTQQIKEEQINFLLEDIEKNPEEYKKAIKIKNKQLSSSPKS